MEKKMLNNGHYNDPSNSSSSVGVGTSEDGISYIEHPISKFDTLAGVAIKYGIQVADIKKLNGLVTDHQMFARKTLQIPSSGSNLSNSTLSDAPDNPRADISEEARRKSAFFESFKLGSSPLLNVSPSICTRQGYYGLETVDENSQSEAPDMSVYPNGGSLFPVDMPFTISPTPLNPPLSIHRKCKSVAFDLYAKTILSNDEEVNEIDLMSKAPETLMKEEVSSGCVFAPLGSKGLALRPKSVTRTNSGGDSERGFPSSLCNYSKSKNTNGFRRSCSTTSLQDAENYSTSSSCWLSSKWSLKQDRQPIFDGLPKPMTGRKSKAAVD